MSVVHAYQPMVEKPPATEAEIQAMREKLATRSKTIAQPSGVGESAQPKAKLEWHKPTSTLDPAVKTKCGRYSCCKVTVNGKPHYELWKLAPGGGWFARIDKGSGLDNFLQAQVLAQQDAEKRT